MAIQPPPAQIASQPVAAPPKAGRSGCFGCSLGCGGCLLVLVLIALLIGGGGWYFFVVQASAAITAPASLVVISQPITVDGNPGTPGQSLNPGNTVSTGSGGHGAIDFPDGSYMRLAPGSTVQINSVQLQKNGNLQTIALAQKVGRTFTNVQHLANGASFSVSGHSVTAAVRGTQFEILVRPDHTNRIWVFVGQVRVTGKTSVTMTAGQEMDIDADGKLSSAHASTFDPTDPFPMAQQCSDAVSRGNNQGTSSASYGDPINNGQSAESDYYSPGGKLTVSLCYPGSTMAVTVTDPNGMRYSKQGSPPVTVSISNGPPGLYRALVTAVSVPASGEAYSVGFATDAPCSAGNIDTGSVVRETLSNSQISNALAEAGTSGVTIYVSGTSPSSARIVYYSSVGGLPVSWIIDFYAATPDLGAVITQATIHGIDVKTEVISAFGSFGGRSITSIPSGFVVDRVYSCAAANGDNMMVVEGHR
ncbi:MAG TPA: FecR family protein [Candidatus Acidoferrum sp.]|nr:FecR family protein [Candidatus Acidoferrum sp.]